MWSQFLKLSPGKKLVYATGGSLGVGIATMSITELLAGNSQQVELERRQLQARIPRLAAQQRAAEGDARAQRERLKAMVEATKTATFSEKLSMAGNALVSFHLPAPAAEAIKAPSLQERTTRDLNAVTTDFIPSVEFEINRFPTRRRSTPVA